MNVIEQTLPSPAPIPGVSHATWASGTDGLRQLSVWRQTLAPGAATPPHRHECDEVVMCHSGDGELHIDGSVQRFAGPCTVILPKDSMHQLFNVGATPMELTAVFDATPVATFLPDGSALDLPWRS